MRNAVIGLIIGIVAGIVLGTTLIAPRLAQNGNSSIDLILDNNQQNSTQADAGAPDNRTPTTAPDRTYSSPTLESEATIETPNPQRLRMVSAFAETLAAHGTAAKRLERTVWRISEGALDLRFHPPGALVADEEALNAVISGAIDAYFMATEELAAREPAFQLFAGPPFGGGVAAFLAWMSDGGGRQLFEELLTNKGLSGVLCGVVPRAGGGWFKKPLIAVDDFKGLKIRAVGVEARLYGRLGADIVDLSFADTMVAMESGLLGAAVLSAPNVDAALGAARAGTTYYVPGWRAPATTFALVMPTTKWDELSSAGKTQIRVACGENIRLAIAEGEALQYPALKQITKKGAEVQPWPAEIKDAVRAAWETEAAERARENRIYARVFKSFRDFRKGQSVWDELSRP